MPRLADFSRLHPHIELNLLTGNEHINLHGYGIDLTLNFDARTPMGLAIHPLMDEFMVPVCSPQYASDHGLMGEVGNLQQCRLLHDRQAWGLDTDSDEWRTWGSHWHLSLEVCSSHMGFDRADLAILAATHHAGVAMGRRQLASQALASGALVMPFPDMAVRCEPRYYLATLPHRQCPKIQAFIRWIQDQAQGAS